MKNGTSSWRNKEDFAAGMPHPLNTCMNVTEQAFERIQKVLSEDDSIEEGAALRVYVQGGGCSGFQYGFKIEQDGANEDDLVLEGLGATVVIDPMSLMYLDGAHLDYKKGLEGEMFTISNPNATTTCGCGSSFGA